MTRASIDTSEPGPHVQNVKGMLEELINHLREDAGKIREPKAQALFETGAEVLQGLHAALARYQQGTERGTRR